MLHLLVNLGLADARSTLPEFINSYDEAWWWPHHAVGMFFSVRDWETSQDRGKDELSKVQIDS